MLDVSETLGSIEDLSAIRMELSVFSGKAILEYTNTKEGNDININSLIKKREGAFTRIKVNSPILVSFENSNAKPDLGFYIESEDGITKIERGLNVILASKGISHDDILNAIEINFKNPFIEGKVSSDDTSDNVKRILESETKEADDKTSGDLQKIIKQGSDNIELLNNIKSNGKIKGIIHTNILHDYIEDIIKIIMNNEFNNTNTNNLVLKIELRDNENGVLNSYITDDLFNKTLFNITNITDTPNKDDTILNYRIRNVLISYYKTLGQTITNALNIYTGGKYSFSIDFSKENSTITIGISQITLEQDKTD